MAVRVSQLPLFRLPIFPGACLRRALALYYVLSRLGCPVQIHFGVQKGGHSLDGHSWVTLRGAPIADPDGAAAFSTVYSFPSTRSCYEPQTRGR